MLTEIGHALKTGNVAALYESISGKKLDWNCGQCIADAKIYLQVKEQELLRELAPIHVYLLHPSEETFLQNQSNEAINKLTVVQSVEHALTSFDDNAVNVIAEDVFFINISNVKQIKPYQAYAIDRYTWNGNGTAKHEKDNPCVWVFRGRVKRITELSLLLKSGYVVSNPYQHIHALRLNN